VRGQIEVIKDSGRKAAAIVQDLLTLARRGVTVTEVVNLNDIITAYLESPEFKKLEAYHPGVEVHTRLDPDLKNMVASPVHLSKTVMNMVSNAAEAMPGGGGLTISTENRYIDAPINGYDSISEGDYILLTVRDTGIGISTEDLERIFEPFYTKKVMGRSGTGLGMAVVYGTVKDLEGHIDVESVEGKGTEFHLYFPSTRQCLDRSGDTPPGTDVRGRGESILVVDDEAQQRDVAKTILTELGYKVRTVPGGQAAIEFLEGNTADLVVLDMIMDPGMDGLDTFREIVKRHPSQRAIIASGYSETDRVKEAQRLGAGYYLKKPYTIDKLGAAVRRGLDN
jgi:CheY-like chemotaxis protein